MFRSGGTQGSQGGVGCLRDDRPRGGGTLDTHGVATGPGGLVLTARHIVRSNTHHNIVMKGLHLMVCLTAALHQGSGPHDVPHKCATPHVGSPHHAVPRHSATPGVWSSRLGSPLCYTVGLVLTCLHRGVSPSRCASPLRYTVGSPHHAVLHHSATPWGLPSLPITLCFTTTLHRRVSPSRCASPLRYTMALDKWIT